MKRFKNSGNPSIFIIFVLIVSVIFSLLYNTHLILNNYPSNYFMMAFLVTLANSMMVWYIFALNRWVFLIFTPLLFGTCAAFNFFIRQIKINMSIDMFEIIIGTNVNEAVGVINKLLLFEVLLGLVIGCLFVVLRFYLGGLKNWKYIPTLAILLVVFILVAKPADKLLREERLHTKGNDVGRGLDTMPVKLIENIYHYWLNTKRFNDMLKKRAAMPAPKVEYDGGDKVVVLLLTDALRPDHMQLNGYARPTTPNMVSEGMISFDEMYACQTSTTKSVPCLTTRGSRANIQGYLSEPSLLKMFKQAGFDTAWISSQYSLSTSDAGATSVAKEADFTYFNTAMNTAGENVYDLDLLPVLDEFLARPNGKKFIVLHLNGSHWNYITRYPEQFRMYTPECSKWVYDCTPEEIINTYDNTIHATDELFKEITERLNDKNTELFLTSDHGQFLGENGRRLHSYNMMGFKELVVVPFGIWLSKDAERGRKFKNILKNKNEVTTHDNLFHSVTDCAGLKSDMISKDMSVCSDNLTKTEKKTDWQE